MKDNTQKDKFGFKMYKVVNPDLINPDASLGNQEPIDNDLRDLVNVNDPEDRFMANPDDFQELGEIITEDQFQLVDANYVDDQGVGTADFAYRTEYFDVHDDITNKTLSIRALDLEAAIGISETLNYDDWGDGERIDVLDDIDNYVE